MIFIVLAALCLNFSAIAQNKTLTDQSLKIGDTIPEQLWHLPLQVTNHSEGRTAISLNDYRGKVIILDFWNTWCVSCILAFPHLQDIQQTFGNDIQILPVSTQNNKQLSEFLKTNSIGKKISLPLICNDSMLTNLFKHKMISHLVWIDKKGKIRATTWSEFATAKNVEAIIKNEEIKWVMKNDMLSFNKSLPLLSFSKNGSQEPDIIYHSVITGHLNGINPTEGIIVDEVKRTVRRYDINADITSLCVRAWNKTLPILSSKQFIYEVKDITRYIKPDSLFNETWNQANTYSYESVLPISYTKDQLADILKNDLKRYLKVEGYLEKRPIQCIIISKIATHKPNSVEKPNKTKITLLELVRQLNNTKTNIPFVIIDKGIGNIPIPYIAGLSINLNDLKATLNSSGLQLSIQDKELEVFIIHENLN